MQPIKDKVFAEKLEDSFESSQGIFIGQDILNSNLAKVILVGPKVKYVKPGDVVKYRIGTGNDHYHNGKNCIFLKEEEHIERVL